MRKNIESHNPASRFTTPAGRTWRAVLLTLFAIWSLFPIYWIGQMAFKSPIDSQAIPPVWFFTPQFDAFVQAFTQVPLLDQLRNSALVAFGSTAVALALAIPGAYSLTRLRTIRSKNLEFWILSTRMAPPVVVAVPFYLTFQWLGLLDTIPGLILMHVLVVIGIVTWIMLETFDAIPADLQESALVDGCTPWTAFLRILLPLARSGAVGAAVISFLLSWNEFFFALILTSLNARTATVGVFNFIGFQSIDLNALAAASILLLLPAVIVVAAFQRYLIAGLTLGAVKG
ncbi:MAG: carbohydrate ABC transporter permease [Actinobacteria bacterium]|nr:carbohydrate ABC transporter permease [Actinomycetota bacterium]